jgi:diguanylate cyclase (GGDEF)-like protein
MTSRPSPLDESTNGPFVGFAAAAHAAVTQLNRQLPGMSLWLVTCVIENRQLVVASAGEWAERAPAGTEFSWQASLCLRMVNGAPAVAPDIASEPAYRQATIGPLANVRAYLGIPLLTAEGELFGTLCALAGAPRPAGWHDAMPSVSVVARMLSTVLAGERASHDRSIEAAHAYALADRDPLTGLKNRRGLEQAVWTEQGRGQRFGTRSSIVVITVHPGRGSADAVSDGALRRCAEVLTTLCEPGDVAACTDGTEFVLLAAETDLLGVRALQTRIRHALRTADVHGSVGVATQRPREELMGTWARAQHALHIDERRRAHTVPIPRVQPVPRTSRRRP